MRCIFCKLPSHNSKSEEHIVPESLGNTEHILPPGWVCDRCNNYIARKVEAPFLESWYGQNSRFEMGVRNKKGLFTPGVGLHFPTGANILMRLGDGQTFTLSGASSKDEELLKKSRVTYNRQQLVFLAPVLPPDTYETSRFIAKIALEILAKRGMEFPKWNDEIVDKYELDGIRRYVREGIPSFKWPISIRRIYQADFPFSDSIDLVFQILHEWDILFIDSQVKAAFEVYAVIAIFGVEYAINLGGPELDGYERWLKEHGDRSYLYDREI